MISLLFVVTSSPVQFIPKIISLVKLNINILRPQTPVVVAVIVLGSKGILMDVMSPESYWLLLGAVAIVILLQGVMLFRQYRIQQAAQAQLSAMNETFVKHRRQIELEFAELNQFIINDTAELKRKAGQREEKVDQLRASVSQQFQQIQQANQSLLSAHTETSEALRKLMIQVYTGLKTQQGHMHNSMQKGTVELKSLNEQHLYQLVAFISSLKTQNIADLTNAVVQQQGLQVETDDMIQFFDNCKVSKAVDKHTGQVTQFTYSNGMKSSSETFADGKLKYQMEFSSLGKPLKGLELDDQGKALFEYHYDEAGEIKQRLDFSYNQHDQKRKSVEVNY